MPQSKFLRYAVLGYWNLLTSPGRSSQKGISNQKTALCLGISLDLPLHQVWRRIIPRLRLSLLLKGTKNRVKHLPPGNLTIEVSSFFEEAPPLSMGVVRASPLSRTVHIKISGKQGKAVGVTILSNPQRPRYNPPFHEPKLPIPLNKAQQRKP